MWWKKRFVVDKREREHSQTQGYLGESRMDRTRPSLVMGGAGGGEERSHL